MGTIFTSTLGETYIDWKILALVLLMEKAHPRRWEENWGEALCWMLLG